MRGLVTHYVLFVISLSDRVVHIVGISSFCIGESDPFAAQPFLQHPVLGLKELDDDQLVSMHPA